MCEFCTQHGEGKKWYLAMENYSIELLDQKDRRTYAAEFLNGFHARVPRSVAQLDKIRRTPLMKLAKLESVQALITSGQPASFP